MKQKNCIILGAGIGGLATAVRLAAAGHQVTVIEQNNSPGGKMREIKRDGFRFDTGPSLFTLPAMVEELLRLGEQDHTAGFQYHELSTVCRYFYEDGTQINAYDEPTEFAREASLQTGEPEDKVHNYLQDMARRYQASANLFIFNPIQKLFQAARRESPSNLRPLLKVNPLQTMHAENRRRFRSPQLVQLFDRYATYNGSSPYMASSMLNVIAHLEHNTGAYFPANGMHSIVKAVYEKARSMGVKFRFGCRVKNLIMQNEKIAGVQTTSGDEYADLLVSDIDVHSFYRKIAQNLKRPLSVKHPNLSSSAIIFYWGMDGTWPQLDVHNILFSGQYKEEFRSLFKKRELFVDPTVYIFVSSKIVPGDAPTGKENWFVMINVPSLARDEVPENFLFRARELVIQKIRRVLKINPSPHILFEETATPQTIEDFTGSYLGALYGNNSNSLWSAFLRHSNQVRKYPNLLFTGGSVHPGGGIPLCLASASIVAKEIEKTDETNMHP